MPTPSTIGTEVLILIVRFGMVVAIYAFLWHVLRVTSRQIRTVAKAQAEQVRPNYGTLLVVESHGGPALNRKYNLTTNDTTIGSARGTPGNRIVLEEPGVAPSHARIVWRDRSVWLENCNSMYSTLLNDAPITAPVLLQDGDRVTVGQTTLKWIVR